MEVAERAEEHCPEIAALMMSERLSQQVEELLPLRADGTAARPDEAATLRAALLAMLKVRRVQAAAAWAECVPAWLQARTEGTAVLQPAVPAQRLPLHGFLVQVVFADYLCPEEPPSRAGMFDRLVAYLHCISPPPAGTSSSAAGSDSDGSAEDAAAAADQEALASVLRLYMTAAQLGGDLEGLQIATQAASALAAPDQQAAAERALARLAAAEEAAAAAQQEAEEADARPPQADLPSLAQLRYAVCHLAAESALQVAALSSAGGGGDGAAAGDSPGQEAVQAAEDGSIGELLELEPDNCKGLVLAALACGRAGEAAERAALLYLSAHRLAQQQGSDWWAVLAACRALAHAAEQPGSVEVETLEAAVDAFDEAQPALRRCRRALPPAWVQQLDAGAKLAAKLLPAARQQLGQAGSSGGGGAEGSPEDAAAEAAAQAECGYCGAAAAELRCARCRRQVYCRWGVQGLCMLLSRSVPSPTASGTGMAHTDCLSSHRYLRCSRDHQKADWATHKLSCTAA